MSRATERKCHVHMQAAVLKGRRLLYELNQDTIYNPSGAATLLFLGTCVACSALPRVVSSALCSSASLTHSRGGEGFTRLFAASSRTT
jgi:hypothetical protein